ncbi:MAG: DNA mismatch repair endonuclease MutL [Pseudomonadota bacterium]
MSNRIQILNENVINRIAAGEVVERPASVVKELVENSIDGKSQSIELAIHDGGKKLIRVKDNGVGMSRDDAFLALERHATSKLISERDLTGIPTMGFRGEALASIASVCRMRLMTKDEYGEVGIAINLQGGSLNNSEPFAMNQGTIIEVRNLFYNTPVRRKYLKSAAFESGHIHDLILKVALANPSIGFTFIDEEKTRIQAPIAKSLKERVYGLFSADIVENFVELHYELEGSSLSGYFAKPPYTKSSIRHIFTFVNSRPVRDRLVNAAIMKSFSNLIERGRFPMALVFIQTPPEEVDVNVHPQKAEVRFLKPVNISNLIFNGVNEAIRGSFLEKIVSTSWGGPSSTSTEVFRYAPQDQNRNGLHESQVQRGRSEFPGNSPQPDSCGGSTVSEPRFSDLHIIGKLPNSFILLNDDNAMIVMDQHAAHERLIFNALCNSSKPDHSPESQDLLIPEVMELTALESEALRENLEVLQNSGFVMEEFGSNTFLVRSIPSWLLVTDLNETIREFVDTALDTGLAADTESLRDNLLKSLACKAAVKETPGLEVEEIRKLLTSLDTTDGPSEVCPHGRPILVRITYDELRRRMGRK